MNNIIKFWSDIKDKEQRRKNELKRKHDCYYLINVFIFYYRNADIPYHLMDNYLNLGDEHFFLDMGPKVARFGPRTTNILESLIKYDPSQSQKEIYYRYLKRIINSYAAAISLYKYYVHLLLNYAIGISRRRKISLIKKLILPDEIYYHTRVSIKDAEWWKILYEAGADVNIVDDQGDTFWQYEIKKGSKLEQSHIDFLGQLVLDGHINIDNLIDITCKYDRYELFWKFVAQPWANFQNGTVLAGWFIRLLKASDLSDIVRITKTLYKCKRLHPSFMVLIFNFLSRKGESYTRLNMVMTELADEFVFCQQEDFDFIGYRDVDEKTICQKLEEGGCNRALNILKRVKIVDNDCISKKSNYECIICMEKANACLTTCRHFGFCVPCAKKMKQCPVCRVDYKIDDIMELYYL